MPVLEEKRLQAACARLVQAIDAQEVLACRSGDRPGRGAGEAGRDRTVDRPYGRSGSVGEADRPGCFDPRDHDGRLQRRRVRSDERACPGLSRTWRNAGRLETDGRVIHPDTGTPQGGGVSPVLAHVS
jgi:hypothetical protein